MTMHSTRSRPTWLGLRPEARTSIEDALGSRVRAFTPATGGFSPALAGHAELADGRDVFVKAIDEEAMHPSTQALWDAEEAVQRERGPEAWPALRSSRRSGGWHVLEFDLVRGQAPLPWTPARVRALRDALALAHRADASGLPSVVARYGPLFRAWASHGVAWEASGDPAELMAEVGLATLQEWEENWPDLMAGDAFLHADVRADNLMELPDGRCVLVDWAWGCRGPAWFDAAFAIPNLVAEGAGDADPLWGLLTAGLPTVQAAAVTATLACMVGCYARESLREPLPDLRAHQRVQAEVTAQWLLARVLRRPVHALRARRTTQPNQQPKEAQA